MKSAVYFGQVRHQSLQDVDRWRHHDEEVQDEAGRHDRDDDSQESLEKLRPAIPEDVVDQGDIEYGEVNGSDASIDHRLRPLEADIGNDAHDAHHAAAHTGSQRDDKEDTYRRMDVPAKCLQRRFPGNQGVTTVNGDQ